MRRRWLFQLCWLAVLGCASAALAQNPYNYTPYDPYRSYNPFSQVPGPAGSRLSQYYQQSGSSLNQIALRNAQALMANNAPQQSSMGAARIGLGVGGTSSSGYKPFAGYTPTPTVSPYLNLFRTDLRGDNAFNYSTLVQPLLQQQQTNQQLQRQQMQVARRLQAIAAQNEYNPQGSKELYPTGHQTVFQYLGHYYPATQPRQRRQR